MKRTLIIIGAVLLVIALAVGAYFLFFAPKKAGIVVDTGQNPFGTSGDYTGAGDGQQPTGDTVKTGEEVAPNLVRITQGPVALGSLVFLAPKEIVEEEGPDTGTSSASVAKKGKTIFVPEVRYVERKSGNVYKYEFNEKLLSRISNRTLPGIQEAAWTADGKTAFLRFLSANQSGTEVAETYALPTESEGGYLLESGLDQVVVSGTSTVITLLPSTTGSIATAARADGANAKTLFTSSLSSLRLYPAGKGVGAFTKPSAQMDGFGFMVSAAGAFDRILGPYRGFTMLPSPSGKQVAYSYLSGQTLVASVMDTATRASTALPVALLPEKCVWAADEQSIYCAVPRSMSGSWPDSWYQGAVSFSDRIWKIDLLARTAVLVVDSVAVANTPIDGVSLSIDANSDVLLFTNKADGSLWAYDL
jgi:hypothetical protein